jgi:hypothetical protein
MNDIPQTALDHLPEEEDLRRRLGIPPDAHRVLILAESSHWDPNWLYTSEEYYTRWVDHNLLQAVAELGQSPRRVYSVECMFFLRLFWERHPELQDNIRELVNAGRLRLTSSGVTSADTLTPDAEAILRDLTLGQKWLRDQGMLAEPRLAYFPDCFGHTPALPSLLNAAGFTMTAFSRLDGMYMVGCDYYPPSAFPRPGSSAEILLKREKCLDFIWHNPDGSQLLAHWNAFTYGQGDMLAYRGISRVYLLPRFLYRADRSDRLVANRIRSFVTQLEPLSRTPYLFCPIGFDFVAPIPDLVSLLDRYNQQHYPDTGTWVVNAGLDDYLKLVHFHRERLPVLDLDPNPYWTGFYTSRPSLKKRSHVLLNRLLEVEGNAVRAMTQVAASSQPAKPGIPDLTSAWWSAATANHHDFITGTSPDRVVASDQVPMLDRALGEVEAVLGQFQGNAVMEDQPPVVEVASVVPAWERDGDTIRVTTPYYSIVFSETAGGSITRAWNPVTDELYLIGNSNELVDIRESGGLWRMGMEFKGGKFQALESSSKQTAHVDVQSGSEGLELSAEIRLAGQVFHFAVLCRSDSPVIRFRVKGRAQVGHTLTARFHHGLAVEQLAMENPGGVISRPAKKIFDPTFWPVQHFYHLKSSDSPRGMALLLALPGAIACHAQERFVELITHRNATQEKAYGLIPILACPAKGHELEETTFQYAILFTQTGDWQANRLPQQARDYVSGPWIADLDPAPYRQAVQDVLLDSQDVWVEALKPAWRGEGIIVRLWSFALPTRPVLLGLRSAVIRQAWECDARERDLHPLVVREGQVRLDMQRSIASVRLLI